MILRLSYGSLKSYIGRSGAVLIDEIDLHLHLQWHQTILSDLHVIFPEVQFIASSHVPAVINSVSREQIRILDHGEIYMPAAQTYGRDANSILREVMKVSERQADIKRRMDLFYAYMDENNYEEADNVLTKMEAIVGTTDLDSSCKDISGFGKNIGGIEYGC